MPTSPDSTPTRAENARTLLIVTLLTVAVSAYVVSPDARFGLGLGFVLGAVSVFAFAVLVNESVKR